jgi:opacity protein-like surface antigen
MKKLVLITVAFIVAGVFTSYAQTKSGEVKKEKQDQSELFNNFYASYGIGTIYYFIDNESATADYSTGTFLLGYSRSLNKVIAVGFQVSFTNIGRTENDYIYNYQTGTSTENENKMDDNLWQGMANVRFQYLNRQSFCMYSGIGMGVTMDNYSKTYYDGTHDHGQKLLPAGQLTLLGFRVGRALSFFGEFGIGTQSILQGGVSYKFGDNL